MTDAAPPTTGGPPVAEPPPPILPDPRSGGDGPAGGGRLVRLALGFYGVITLFAVGYAAFSHGLLTLFGERTPTTGHLLAALAVGLGIVALCHVGDRLLPSVGRAGRAFTEILGPYSYPQAILLAVVSGFGEELLFRGALWPHLGLVGTSLLFGLVHVLPRRSLVAYPLFAAAVGLLLGLLRDGTGSVVPPMLSHAVVNALNLAWLEHRRRAAAVAP